ncbi:MAG TPA: sodium/solute symporter [Chitinophagaceae bacterium]|nr:sodium/solute symporter [Chitinophagaceae bacterium]
MSKFGHIDYAIFAIYFVVVSCYGYWIYQRKKKKLENTTDFFLAEGKLTWWAIGASLIASNISAEQFIGMSGNGFSVGIAVAAYEWIAAVALIIVAVWFMPIYLKNRIFTMPQFLKTRYNESSSLIMAILWLLVYIVVNLTSILFLGTLAINNLAGGGDFHTIEILMAVFALVITLGGMKVIGYTDVIQVMVLIIGGLATTYVALNLVGERFGVGKDAIAGFNAMVQHAPNHFKMIMAKPGPHASQAYIDKYMILPGIAMYYAGEWIVNLNYWGCNQYITQRALGAKLQTARTGILFAGFMKLLMPLIVMLPGIAAYVLYTHGGLSGPMASGGKFNPDNAYSSILGFLPHGMRGLALAALTAAIVSSLAGKANSISTIFTLDIYKKYIEPKADEQRLVWIGRWVIVIAMVFSILLTWWDTMGIGRQGGFTYIQKYTGFISPGVFAIFILGMFWKRTTAAASIVGIIGGVCLSIFFNQFAPLVFGNNTWLYTAYPDGQGHYYIPFLIAMGLAFAFTVIAMVAVSLAGPRISAKAFVIDKSMFKLKPNIIVMIVVTLVILCLLYIRFW